MPQRSRFAGSNDLVVDGVESANGPMYGDHGEPPHNGGMLERLSRLEAILPHLATKADVGEVRADIQRGIGETHKWMIATVIGLFIGFGGLFLAMSNALKPAATTATPPPIIINVPNAAAPAPAAPASR